MKPLRGAAGIPILAWAVVAQAAPPPDSPDAGVNAIYDRMSAAYRACDPEALAMVYTADAVLFPSRPNLPPVIGRDAIARGPGAMLASAKPAGCKLAIRFRVAERRQVGASVIDTGLYHLVTADAGGAPRIAVGKFLITAARLPDGRWAFASDTDTPMPLAAWDAAVPAPNAKFDQ